jgi:uncharacterized damage-inducible protein DinB
MRRTPWFERQFPAIEDNGLLPGILERLAGTAGRLRSVLDGVERSTRVDTGWSLAQEVGHMADLEPLWLQRAEDLIRGAADLTAADLTNRRTHEADHDRRPLPELVDRFARARAVFVARLRSASESDLEHAARHPRLGTQMRLVDLAYFVAEHDDHHLVKIRELAGSSAH